MNRNNEYKTLILDDLESVIDNFKNEIRNLEASENIHISVVSTQTEKDTFKELEKQKFDLLFIDQKLKEGKKGSEVAKRIKEKYNEAYIVMQTAFGLESAEEGIRSQAFSDFISKSQDDKFTKELLLQIFIRYDKYRESQEELTQTRKQLDIEKRRAQAAEIKLQSKNVVLAELQKDFNIDISKFDDKDSELKGNSSGMMQIRWFINLYAKVELPVLILGETGTGKELVAKEIHHRSSRRHQNCVIINCAAIPENLIESELFGAKKGAYTDRKEDSTGAFKLADNGTLFLDEIGDMSLNVQAKVLRAINDGTFRPLGAPKDEKVNVRLICATSRNLVDEFENSIFRKDLFYRMRSLFPKLPPLKDRREDIKDIYIHLCKIKKWDFPFTNDAIQSLIEKDYDWGGNVRELIKFFEHTIAIFPNSKFDKDKTIKLLELWQEHKPVSGIETEIFIKDTSRKNRKGQLPISLEEAKCKNALEVIKMLNSACLQVENITHNKEVALNRLNECAFDDKHKESIRKLINEGNFEHKKLIGLFCKSKKGIEGMKFEAIYGYLTSEVFTLLDSEDTDIINKLGDISPFRRRLGDTIERQRGNFI